MDKNDICYKACIIATENNEPQGSKQSQVNFDKAIELCPTFDYAYLEKAVPYLKRGDFINWKKIIDKAVELNPSQHLGYRGWCRFQFLRDYDGAINDLEKLDSILDYDIGYSIDGDYHLKIALALCYKGRGEIDKAIKTIENQLAQNDYSPGSYDFLHLGVLKLESGDLKGAEISLLKQIEINDYLAETQFYLALTNKKLNNRIAYLNYLEKAKDFYLKNKKRVDLYTHSVDKVYLKNIEDELSLAK